VHFTSENTACIAFHSVSSIIINPCCPPSNQATVEAMSDDISDKESTPPQSPADAHSHLPNDLSPTRRPTQNELNQSIQPSVLRKFYRDMAPEFLKLQHNHYRIHTNILMAFKTDNIPVDPKIVYQMMDTTQQTNEYIGRLAFAAANRPAKRRSVARTASQRDINMDIDNDWSIHESDDDSKRLSQQYDEAKNNSNTRDDEPSNNAAKNLLPTNDSTIHWPQGNTTYTIDAASFYTGWCFAVNGASSLQSGHKRTYRYCLGVFRCVGSKDCQFLARPIQPRIRSYDTPPRSPPYECPHHPSVSLKWIRCIGSRDLPNTKAVACTLTITPIGDGTTLEVNHYGTHNHPRPPTKKATPQALEKLHTVVMAHPNLRAGQLKVGYIDGSGQPATEIDHVFHNRDNLAYEMRKCRRQNRNGPDGITNDLTALLRFQKDMGPEPFFKKVQLLDTEYPIISLQTPYMEMVLNESPMPFKMEPMGTETDTVEGEIEDLEFGKGRINVHITSKKDMIVNRWVPVLISLIFGRSQEYFYSHWTTLFQSIALQHDSTWEDFAGIFVGTTVDFSAAQFSAFTKAFKNFAMVRFGKRLTTDHVSSFIRECHVHFRRSCFRIKRNKAVVPMELEADFERLVTTLENLPQGQFAEFYNTCKVFIKTFPNASKWILWYMKPVARAKSYFPEFY
jgi:hypothetical protein